MPKPLATLLNVIWLVLGGVWLALGYVVAGVIGCVLIVTIPAGIASLRMARYVLWPFGRTVVPKPGTAAMNVIWMIVAGWWLALLHIISALAQAVTIVGIANAVVSLKMIPISVMPFGKQIVSTTSNR